MSTLPVPDADSAQHSQRMADWIAAHIAERGPIPFSHFMQLALYAPGLGYYSAGAHKLGEAGDFVTAPEISPLFSRCLARQCAQVGATMPAWDILELGGGRGVMAAEILRTLALQDNVPRHYYMLDVSADLRARQVAYFQANAPAFLDRVKWLTQWPADFCGVVLANEVLDAMPVHKVQYTDQGWQEYYVITQDGQFGWQLGALSDPDLAVALEKTGVTSPGYETEYPAFLKGWMKSLWHAMQKGVVLFIDYGFPRHEYYHPDRTMGTLMCHFRHHAHPDPLILPGIQDITAHVDFTLVAELAADLGFDVCGFTHQAAFLLNCGIADMLDQTESTIDQFEQNNQAKKLILPSEMGELFKVMALSKQFDAPLCGFQQMDQRGRL